MANVYSPFGGAAPGSGSFGYSQTGQDQFKQYQANPQQATHITQGGTRLGAGGGLMSGMMGDLSGQQAIYTAPGNFPNLNNGGMSTMNLDGGGYDSSYGDARRATEGAQYTAQMNATNNRANNQSMAAQWQPDRLANPWADGNAGLMQSKANTSAEYANQFQRSRDAMNQDLGMRGITPDSGLAQNQQGAMAMAEATGRAGAFGALDAENYGRQAAFDTEQGRYINEARMRAAQSGDQWNQQQQNFGLQQNAQNFAQNQALMRNPYELQAMGLSNTHAGLMNANQGLQNQSAQNVLGYQPRMLQQAWDQGNDQHQLGQYNIESARNQNTMDRANLPNYLDELDFSNNPFMKFARHAGQAVDAASGLAQRTNMTDFMYGKGSSMELGKAAIGIAGKMAAGGA